MCVCRKSEEVDLATQVKLNREMLKLNVKSIHLLMIELLCFVVVKSDKPVCDVDASRGECRTWALSSTSHWRAEENASCSHYFHYYRHSKQNK